MTGGCCVFKAPWPSVDGNHLMSFQSEKAVLEFLQGHSFDFAIVTPYNRDPTPLPVTYTGCKLIGHFSVLRVWRRFKALNIVVQCITFSSTEGIYHVVVDCNLRKILVSFIGIREFPFS